MMSLEGAIKKAKRISKSTGHHKIVYRVYDPRENNSMVYVGIGGNGKRKGYGRLEEHFRDFSSLKKQYVIVDGIKESKDMTIIEMIDRWNNLKWDFEMYDVTVNVNQIEAKIELENSPKYNINGKVKQNKNINKFIK